MKRWPVLDSGSVVRQTSDEKKIEDWALVLASAGIAYAPDRRPEGWALVVAPPDELRARRALDDFDVENAATDDAEEVAPARESGWLAGGVGSAALLIGMHYYLHFMAPASAARWYERGSASAEGILVGEVERGVTALTLHQDASHLLGNVAACVIFVGAVSRTLGPGLAGVLILIAGAVGNLLNAGLHGGHYASIGASTAIFGAVGILGGMQFIRRRRRPRRRRSAWIAIAASLGLFAMLGTSKKSDITAHLLGLVVGVVVGVVVALAPRHRPRAMVQGALTGGTVGALVLCWWLALR